jgi:hypothetical protein
MFKTPGGTPASWASSANNKAVNEVFQHNRVAHGQRRRDFPRQHQQGEVPRDDLTRHTKGDAIRQLIVHQLRHPGVVIEMPRDQGHVDVAAFPDRFAIVQSL